MVLSSILASSSSMPVELEGDERVEGSVVLVLVSLLEVLVLFEGRGGNSQSESTRRMEGGCFFGLERDISFREIEEAASA